MQLPWSPSVHHAGRLMKKIVQTLSIIALMLCLVMNTYSGRVYASSTEVNRLKQETENAKNQVNDIKDKKKAAEEATDALEGQADKLNNAISSLNNQIGSVSEEITAAEEDMATVQADIDLLMDQLNETQEDLEIQRTAMKLRIQYMYETRSTNQLVNLLESGSFSEFLQRLEYMQEVSSYDQRAIEKYAATQADLEQTHQMISDKYDELLAYQDALESKNAQLNTLISSTTNALANTNEQINTSKEIEANLDSQLQEAEAYEKKITAQYQAAQVALAQKLAGEKGAYSGGYSSTDSDVLLLAALIQAEADNQGDAGRLAVGSVVMNRVASSKFPNTISGVIYQSGQFAPVTSGRVAVILAQGPNSGCQYAAAQAIAGNINVDSLFFCTYSYAQSLHESQVAAGQSGFLDRTSGTVINAHYFYNYNS